MKYLLLVSIVFILLAGCEGRQDPKVYLSQTHISIPSKYRVLKFDSGWGISTSWAKYKLVIDSTEYQKIIDEIKNKPFFECIGLNEEYPTVFSIYSDSTKLQDSSEIAYVYDNNKYCYEIYLPDGYSGEVVSIKLERDSLMNIAYDEL